MSDDEIEMPRGTSSSPERAAAVKQEVEFYVEVRGTIKKHSGEELDIKPYEADMRHLINTYIQAEPPEDLGSLGTLSLTELIIKTGIHDAIAKTLNDKGRLSRNAIAEGIINNIRKTIVREHLTDPKFYDQMSKLLDDLIQQRLTETKEYEEFLRRAEDLVRKLAAREPHEGLPVVLHGNREATVIYNNLDDLPATTFESPWGDEERAALALRIDWIIREQAPAGWRGDQAREARVKNALYPELNRDPVATLALFEIIKNQPGY